MERETVAHPTTELEAQSMEYFIVITATLTVDYSDKASAVADGEAICRELLNADKEEGIIFDIATFEVKEIKE